MRKNFFAFAAALTVAFTCLSTPVKAQQWVSEMTLEPDNGSVAIGMIGDGSAVATGRNGKAMVTSPTKTSTFVPPDVAEETAPTPPTPTEPTPPTEPVEPVVVGKKGFPWLAIGLVFLIALLGSGIMMYFCCWNKRDEEEEDEGEEKKDPPADTDPSGGGEPKFEVIDAHYTIAASPSNSAATDQMAISGRHQEALPKGKDPGPTVTPRYWG